MPEPLNYATPDLNKRSETTDGIPFVLGSLQLLGAFAALAGSGSWFGTTSNYWYERAAQLYLSDGSSVLVYLCGVSAVIAGTWKVEPKRKWWYTLYALIWIFHVVLAEVSMLVLSPWPGERRFRWIMVHNLHDTFVPTESFGDYPITLLMVSPVLWFLTARSVFNWLKQPAAVES